MSFSTEFYAQSAEDAVQILAAENMPECVKDFVGAALKAVAGPVYVKAFGHLYAGVHAGDYPISSATLEIRPLSFRKA